MAQNTKQLDYPEAMRVIGQFIEQERLSEVSILEYDQGWIIHGLTFKSTAQGFIRIASDHILSHEDVRRLHAQFEAKRQEQSKWRWSL